MGGKKITAKSIRRKNEPMHPDSRRAAQLTRAATRDAKLKSQKSSRKIHNINKVDRISTFVLLVPDEVDHIHDLRALHTWVQESWLPRHDDELSRLKAMRRPGRPPLKEEITLQHRIEAERAEYAAGLELPDLTSPANLRLLREWRGDPQGLNAFRFVRISGKFPEQFTVVQEGIHPTLKYEKESRSSGASASATGAGAGSADDMEADPSASTATASDPAPARKAAGDFYNMDGAGR
ncbi:translation machinery-associated protein 16 [Tilletia horrida]|uniref:Translation machinery-associated protein 16 n=1 Tax=Tilletia horrida TaxID=155126 RepID=A0AAN6GB48_9BASI|nr:translation machinery-associated protein 16 [Tilletia horrida]